ncbi:hypothetical protein Z042_25335 [Chania multitudinisentens RB-25]|uniref:Uncharacterized protein n=1 Tax=Chania multitudinisentens RB-25 TaxID=1441930 RepID=A0A0D4ZXG8_9GAMM|nr:hypothetical protein Z042_25335 [Chania multitudinisentens RB-25]
MYCNTSITLHLLRGVAALALLITAFLAHVHALVFILLLGAAFMLLRGCPMCWLASLFERLQSRKSISFENKDISHE